MQLLNFLLAFTLFTFTYAIPQSPVGSSGSGDAGGSGNDGPGDAVGSAAASSRATRKQHPPPFNDHKFEEIAADTDV